MVTVRFPESCFAEFHFAEAVSPNGHFAEGTFHRKDVSPKERFESISSKGRFAEILGRVILM